MNISCGVDFIEIDRITLIALSDIGYDETNFSVGSFKTFADGLAAKTNKKIKLLDLDGFNAYKMLHMINNFIKHNSIDAYEKLKNNYPNNVYSKENNTTELEYKNGMYAGDWIILKEGYIDNVFGN